MVLAELGTCVSWTSNGGIRENKDIFFNWSDFKGAVGILKSRWNIKLIISEGVHSSAVISKIDVTVH